MATTTRDSLLPPLLTTCSPASLTFHAYSCGTATITVFLNVLVDLNHDGDWNDNVYCNQQGACANEWAVKNVPIQLQPGCNTLTSPTFRCGPNATQGWLRITLSDQPLNDDFPWAGSATTPNGRLQGGETEDYPVALRPGSPQPCESGYNDFGDAPENIAAYPSGKIGHFPTCLAPSAPATADLACASQDPPPGPTGYVKHVTLASDLNKVGLGCGDPAAAATLAADDDPDGKVNLIGAGTPSDCSAAAITDGAEVAFGGMTFGQDENFGDSDAGVDPPTFKACSPATVSFRTFNCGPSVEGFLNILVDMNEDGDWTDTFLCGTQCVSEWAVRNVRIPLPSGCLAQTSPSFMIGPNAGHGWMRVTVTLQPVPPDFAWNGSAGTPTAQLNGGETEDYPVEILPPPCGNISYRDFGDAPEGIAATPTFIGHYPSCLAPAAPAGSQEIECGVPQSIAPPAGAVAGYVEHVANPTTGLYFWFGCGPTPVNGIDDEADAKISSGGSLSTCGQLPVDCVASAFGLSFGQDECYGDGDAGLPSPVPFRACSTSVIQYRAYACDHPVQAYLNILVDWSRDGDWNDNVGCGAVGGPNSGCAPEWCVKNVIVTLSPGCGTYTSPSFQVGPRLGGTWMRMTLSAEPVGDDFPWNGSAGHANGYFIGGETEDYPVTIVPTVAGVDEQAAVPSGGTWFAAPAPNPGTLRTTARFSLAHEAHVTLTVYDVFGRRVNRLVDSTLPAGAHAVEWNYRNTDGAEVPFGIYVMKLQAGDRVLTQRTIHTR
jgi:hypothetical protein